jgi:hypothetical protein
MTSHKWAFTAVVVTIAVLAIEQAQAGVITLVNRESKGKNALFAGSGGAVQQSDVNDSFGNLTGAFSFGDSGMVAVDDSQPFSTGTANAAGSISLTDNVTQSSPGTVVLTATRSASGSANSILGPSSGRSTQSQTFRVRFTTGVDPVDYALTGNFDPGATTGVIGEAGRITLFRPFTTNVPVLINTATAGINEAGTLLANRTYELLVRMTDITSASANNPSNSDASSLDITLTLQSVPEPSAAILLTLASSVLAARRQPRRLAA